MLAADGQLAGTPSVLFDAVAVILSDEGSKALSKESAAIDFVRDFIEAQPDNNCCHLTGKPIAPLVTEPERRKTYLSAFRSLVSCPIFAHWSLLIATPM